MKRVRILPNVVHDFLRIEVAQQIVDSQKQMSQKAAMMKEGKAGSSAGSSKRGGAVIPCSIRCPDMDGEVPTLQCIRCLCLFHAECLGLPPNLQSDQYICSVRTITNHLRLASTLHSSSPF